MSRCAVIPFRNGTTSITQGKQRVWGFNRRALDEAEPQEPVGPADNMMAMLRVLLIAFFWFAATAAAEPDWVTGYPHAELVLHSTAEVDDYLLPLGHFKRIGGLWQPEESLRLSGELRRYTWLLPLGHSVEEAQNYWFAQWQPLLHRVLYTCRGRACGSSHRWAGTAFGIRELAGSDGSQYYDVLELVAADQHYSAALYSVQRGNGRVYTQLDLLSLPPGAESQLWITADTLIRQLRESQPVVLATFGDASTTVAPVQRKALVQALRKDVRLQLDLIGFAYAGNATENDEDALRQRARDYAETLQRQLVEQGVTADRLNIVETEPMVPAPFGAVDRIELRRHSP